jgi:hypothetical protein
VTRTHRPAAVAALAALLLSGCSPAPQPDPDEFWTDLSFYTDLPDEYRAQALAEAEGVCTALAGAQPRNEYGGDSLAAAWQGWVDEMGSDDAGFFWRTSVRHLCPDQGTTLEKVQALDAAGSAGGR